MTQEKCKDNSGKRTLCYCNSEILGIVADLIEVGGRYLIFGLEVPLICSAIMDYPEPLGDEQIAQKQKFNCEKVAHFFPDEEFAKKLKKNYKKKTSQMQEKALAKKFGGKTQIASGALSSFKGDVVHETYLIEAKYSDSAEYRLTLQTWNKIKKEAYEIDKLPLLEVCLDYASEPLKIILCSPSDLNLSMNEFMQIFNSKGIESSGKSILLKKKDFTPHIEDVNYNMENLQPAFLITIGDTLLIGMETDTFEKMFNV